MKRFKWRLQSVLDVKEKQEQLRRTELFELTRKLDQLGEELFRQKKVLSNLIDELAKEAPKNRLEKQAFFMAHAKANDEVIKKIQSNIKELKAQREEKAAEVIELKKLTEGLSQLRTTAEREFIAEQEKMEQRASDEMTTYRSAQERMERYQAEKVNV